MKKQLFLIIIFFFLTGCANIPENLGISKLEWSSYSPKKQNKLIDNYNKLVKERNGLIDIQEEEKKGKDFLVVNIYGGKVMFPPLFINWQDYRPVQFSIFKDRCQDVEISSVTNKNIKTKLGVCFYNNILYLDSSRYNVDKKLGSASIYSSPLWLSGFSYAGVNSSGYVKLSNVTVTIKKERKAAY